MAPGVGVGGGYFSSPLTPIPTPACPWWTVGDPMVEIHLGWDTPVGMIHQTTQHSCPHSCSSPQVVVDTPAPCSLPLTPYPHHMMDASVYRPLKACPGVMNTAGVAGAQLTLYSSWETQLLGRYAREWAWSSGFGWWTNQKLENELEALALADEPIRI